VDRVKKYFKVRDILDREKFGKKWKKFSVSWRERKGEERRV
jgi:hypothetical protein